MYPRETEKRCLGFVCLIAAPWDTCLMPTFIAQTAAENWLKNAVNFSVTFLLQLGLDKLPPTVVGYRHTKFHISWCTARFNRSTFNSGRTYYETPFEIRAIWERRHSTTDSATLITGTGWFGVINGKHCHLPDETNCCAQNIVGSPPLVFSRWYIVYLVVVVAGSFGAKLCAEFELAHSSSALWQCKQHHEPWDWGGVVPGARDPETFQTGMILDYFKVGCRQAHKRTSAQRIRVGGVQPIGDRVTYTVVWGGSSRVLGPGGVEREASIKKCHNPDAEELVEVLNATGCCGIVAFRDAVRRWRLAPSGPSATNILEPLLESGMYQKS
ncbi:hypothetical protein C8J57DRAFT_1460002 [Mycena rebaudengoi]|nr:hypothetical protein C8J57DRAFT_1460002 [Mycena rebaudengoi]